MNGAIVALLAVVLGGGGLAGFYGPKLLRRTAQETNRITERADTIADRDSLIDQYQEDRIEWRAERAELRQDIANLQAQMLKVETVHRSDQQIAFRYIERLRDHIDRRLEPPPPAWPSELKGGLS